MAVLRRYSIEFKRQVVQEYQYGETLHGLAKRHGISRNLVGTWAVKAEAGEFLQAYQARIGALERLVASWRSRTSSLSGGHSRCLVATHGRLCHRPARRCPPGSR
jgi:hypothetical protein